MLRSAARAVLLALFVSTAQGADVVISQIFGGGGNAGAPWRQDFIEILNRGSAPVPVGGWSVQYASATGSTWQKADLPAGVLQPGQYLLIGGAAGAAGAPLPPLDAAGSFNLGATSGKVALVASTALIASGTACPANVVDFVGYGGANCFEGPGAAPGASNTTAVLRSGDGCVDRDSNAADFGVAQPLPRNSLVAPARCSAPTVLRIREIQGRAHLSPWASRAVAGVRGIVTARRNDGFWMQDPEPDDDVATSEAIFVAGNAAVGDAVEVAGIVAEARPGAATNLTITRINAPTVRVLSSGNPLPPPVVLGAGGRIPPAKVIDDDATGDVETSGSFDPAADGIDFYESLEGMRVTVRNAVAIGPTGAFGETPVVGDDGAFATLRSKNGGLLIAADDFNPERILLDNALIDTVPTVNAGDSLGTVTGIIDYSGGAYRLLLTERPIATPGPAVPERASAPAPDQLAIASFNVQNLGATSPPEKLARIATRIVENLRSPDVVALMEMQDDSGEADDGTVAASRNFTNLVLAILAAGGPQYDFRQIDPIDRADGGVPGGNIRVGLLFNPARVQFVDRPGGNATTPVAVLPGAAGPQLSLSPGRIDPRIRPLPTAASRSRPSSSSTATRYSWSRCTSARKAAMRRSSAGSSLRRHRPPASAPSKPRRSDGSYARLPHLIRARTSWCSATSTTTSSRRRCRRSRQPGSSISSIDSSRRTATASTSRATRRRSITSSSRRTSPDAPSTTSCISMPTSPIRSAITIRRSCGSHCRASRRARSRAA